MKLILFLTLLTISSNAMTIRQALGQLESGNNDHAIGKAGEVSRFQIKPDLWKAYPVTGLDPKNPYDAWMVAKSTLTVRIYIFTQSNHREPTYREVYILWNAPAQIKNPSPDVLARAIRFENLVNSK